jgi:nitrogen regulatory protein PII
MDLPENRGPAEQLKHALEKEGLPVLQISAVTGRGLKELVNRTARLLRRTTQDRKGLKKSDD